MHKLKTIKENRLCYSNFLMVHGLCGYRNGHQLGCHPLVILSITESVVTRVLLIFNRLLLLNRRDVMLIIVVLMF
jgi:hypothetical protein